MPLTKSKPRPRPKSVPSLRLTFEAIGTTWQIVSKAELTDEQCSKLTRAIRVRIERFDTDYSRFRPDSLVTRMSQQAGSYELPPDGYKLLHFYQRLYEATTGKVTPLIGQVIADLGYDATYSFNVGQPKQPPAWENVIEFSRQHIMLKQPALLDFGAAGKGYLIDIIGELLSATGVSEYTINAGGDILHKSATNTTIPAGLENPFDRTEIIGIAELDNQSICASSGSRRKWDEYTHIIDPNKLASPTDIQATWVIADTAMIADGLATALFFTKPTVLKRDFTFSYALLRADMSLEYSHDFPAVLNRVSA